MKHRLFIGLPIPNFLQREIEKWKKSVSTLPVRWIAPRNLHLTLLPPWEAGEVESAKENLRIFQQKTRREIPLSFEMVEYGPNLRAPRMIWVKGKPSKPLLNLKESLAEVFSQKEKKRSFLLHITLARFHPHHFTSFPIKHVRAKIHWQADFSELVLYESHLKNSGAEYEVLERIGL